MKGYKIPHTTRNFNLRYALIDFANQLTYISSCILPDPFFPLVLIKKKFLQNLELKSFSKYGFSLGFTTYYS